MTLNTKEKSLKKRELKRHACFLAYINIYIYIQIITDEQFFMIFLIKYSFQNDQNYGDWR